MVREVGCAIIGQTDDLAPADRRLYAIRDVTGTVESIPLITASILSKKLAAGLDGLVMDVKAGNGAFMADPARSRALAAASSTSRPAPACRTTALITDMDAAAGASARATRSRSRTRSTISPAREREPRLHEVVLALGAEMLLLGGLAATPAEAARQRREARLDERRAAETLRPHGGGARRPGGFSRTPRAYLPRAGVIKPGVAEESGFIAAMETRALGIAVIELGGGRRRASDAIDQAVGLSAVRGIGSEVAAGKPLAMVHARERRRMPRLRRGAQAHDPHRGCAAGRSTRRARPHRRAGHREGRMSRAFMLVHGLGRHRFGAGRRSLGDAGADTLGHIAQACREGRGDRAGLRAGPLRLPNLARLGLGATRRQSIPGLATARIEAAFGSAAEGLSAGKDTPSGHWEIAGLPVRFALGTISHHPAMLPARARRPRLSNARRCPASWATATRPAPTSSRELGEEHIRTGKPICYTSADCVLQIAAHESAFRARAALRGLRGRRRADRAAQYRPRDRAAVRRRER